MAVFILGSILQLSAQIITSNGDKREISEPQSVIIQEESPAITILPAENNNQEALKKCLEKVYNNQVNALGKIEEYDSVGKQQQAISIIEEATNQCREDCFKLYPVN